MTTMIEKLREAKAALAHVKADLATTYSAGADVPGHVAYKRVVMLADVIEDQVAWLERMVRMVQEHGYDVFPCSEPDGGCSWDVAPKANPDDVVANYLAEADARAEADRLTAANRAP